MEKAAYFLYLFVLLFSPLAFGSIDLWAVFIVEGCSFLALGCYLFALLRKDQSFLKVPGLVPLLVFLAWMVFQLIPLPRSIVSFVSPATAGLYAPLLATSDSVNFLIPFTVHPLYTVQDLFRFSAYAAVYFLTIQLLSDPKRMQQTLAVVLFLAAAIAFYGIIQHYTGNDRIYWFRTFSHKPVFGTFAYKNHFAGYIELLLPLALVLYFYYRSRQQSTVSPVQAIVNISSPGADNKHLHFLFAFCLMTLAVLLSKSRGGVFCAFLALVLLFILGRKRLTLSRFLPVALGLILLVFATGVGRDGLSTVAEGFGNALTKDGVSMNGRIEFWKNSLHILSDFPITGTGAGTFRAIYPRYDLHPKGAWPLHAHNDFLETQTNGGLIASLSVVAFLFLFFRGTLEMYRKRNDRYVVHLYQGSLTGLVALLLHCLIDLQFGVSMAVGLYFFFLLGVNAASVTLKQHRNSTLSVNGVPFSGMRGWCILASIVLFSCFCTIFQIGELKALALFPEISTTEKRLGKAGYDQKAKLFALESFAVYKGFDAEKKKNACNRASRALHFSPLNPRYRYIRSLCTDSGETLDRALADCRVAFRLSPAQEVYSKQYETLLEKKGEKVAGKKVVDS
jgi:O-antigen ligase